MQRDNGKAHIVFGVGFGSEDNKLLFNGKPATASIKNPFCITKNVGAQKCTHVFRCTKDSMLCHLDSAQLDVCFVDFEDEFLSDKYFFLGRGTHTAYSGMLVLQIVQPRYPCFIEHGLGMSTIEADRVGDTIVFDMYQGKGVP